MSESFCCIDLILNGVYAFRGKVDGSRDTPSLIVDAIEDVEQMEQHSAQSVHIKLDTNFNSESSSVLSPNSPLMKVSDSRASA